VVLGIVLSELGSRQKREKECWMLEGEFEDNKDG
jgi:hypothetical protein